MGREAGGSLQETIANAVSAALVGLRGTGTNVPSIGGHNKGSGKYGGGEKGSSKG